MAYRPCYPEVGDLDLAGLVDQDVARLHVAVYHAPAMGEVERVRDVSAYRGGSLRRQRPWRMRAESVWPSMYSMTMKYVCSPWPQS